MYIELHRHSDFSTLDGCGKPFQFAERAAELGMWALAQTDHGNMNGALEHMKACERVGIQPIVGMEAYYRPNRHVQGQKDWRYRRWHLILLAQNLTGWHNLIRISSEAFRCVAPEMRVLTADLRWVRAEDLRLGDKLLGYSENSPRKMSESVVEHNGIIRRHVYRITLSDGTVLRSSAEHPWLTMHGAGASTSTQVKWTTTQEIVERFRAVRDGHRAAGPRPLRNYRLARYFYPWDIDSTHDGGYLAGLFDGEGYVCPTAAKGTGRSGGLALGMSQNPGVVLENANMLLAGRGYILQHQEESSRVCRKLQIAGGRQPQFEFLGSIRPRRLVEKFSSLLERGDLGILHKLDGPVVVDIQDQGFQDVVALSTSTKTYIAEGFGSHNSGFYQDPCIDDELLDRYHEGIYCTTSCVLGPLSYLIQNATDAQIDAWLDKMAWRFNERLSIAIQPHDFDRQRAVNLESISRAQRKGIPLTAEGDAHYVLAGTNPTWAQTQKIVALVSTNTTMVEAAAKNRERLERGDEVYELGHEGLHLMSGEEMAVRFAQYHPQIPPAIWQEAIDNTEHVAQMCVPFMIDRTLKMPKAASSQQEAERFVRVWCREGMERIGKVGDEIYERQLEYEFDIMRQKKVFDYIYLTGDVVRWSRSTDPLPPTEDDPNPQPKRPIRVGSSRGSAGASLVCYLSRITGINPINHKLKFERFLNPGRKGIPDIDIDFPDDRRDLVKEYVARKYGRECVADIVAMSRFTPRAAIQDVARIIGIDYNETKKATDVIDPVHDEDLYAMRMTIPELDAWATKYPEAFEHAARLENHADPFCLRLSKHAGGVIITPGPINDYMPTIKANESDITPRTAWSETPRLSIVDDYGFCKWDFLSITGMTQQDRIVAQIAERTGEELDLDQLPICFDPYAVEPEVMSVFQRGLTLGIWQFEGAAITAFMKRAMPSTVVDLAAINALFRPGPMGAGGHNRYAKRRRGEEQYTIPEPLVPVLSDTMGVHCFQEQIMEIFQVLVGYTAAQADDVRKEIDKLNRGKSDQGRIRLAARAEEFITKASALIGKEAAEHLWSEILPYTGYCLSGDTVVIRGAAGRHAKQETTLRDLNNAWRSKTHVGKKLRRVGVTILAMDEDGRIRPSRVKKIWSNGVKEVFEIKTASGRCIRATANHRFLTAGGYKTCDRLSGDDELVVVGNPETQRSGTRTYSTERARGKTYVGMGMPSGESNPAWIDGRRSLLNAAKEQVATRAGNRCESCGHESSGRKHELEFAHINSLESMGGDYRRYHSLHNIRRLCNSCHKSLDYRKGERRGRWSKGLPTDLDRIVSIQYVGNEEVFDVEMDSVEHNFIANGIVSHNSFNRPHASGYSVQAYQDAWLKVHYPFDFYSVLLTLEDEKAPRAVKEAKHFDVAVEHPDVNRSKAGFSVDFDANVIRFGLIGIRDVGPTAAEQVMEKAPYESIEHFNMSHSFKYTKVNKGHREALVEAGALDSLGARADWTEAQKAVTELKRLNMALRSGGTFGDDEDYILSCVNSEEEFDTLEPKDPVVVAGRISDVRFTVTKRGKNPGQQMSFVRLQFALDSFQCTLFPPAHSQCHQLLEVGRGVIIRGRKDDRDQIIVEGMMGIEEWLAEMQQRSAA